VRHCVSETASIIGDRQGREECRWCLPQNSPVDFRKPAIDAAVLLTHQPRAHTFVLLASRPSRLTSPSERLVHGDRARRRTWRRSGVGTITAGTIFGRSFQEGQSC